MADGDGETDIIDLSGNGKGVALNVDAPQAFIDDVMPATDPNAFDRVRSVLGITNELSTIVLSSVKPVATIAALKAETVGIDLLRYVTDSNRKGIFKYLSAAQFLTEYGIASTVAVAADAQNGLLVAPTSDPIGAIGVWVRCFTGPALSTWWGVAKDATAATNTAAYNAALATLKLLAVTGYGYNIGSIGLHTPAGHYLFNNKLTVSHALKNTGDYAGGFTGGGTVFEWTSFTHGFDVLGWDGVSQNGTGAKFDGFYLLGPGLNAGARGFWNAINFAGHVKIYNCMADNWGGSGYCGIGNFAGNAGNVNDSHFENIVAQNCDWTLFLDGPDANGCKGFGISAITNRFGGIGDFSFLGNAFYGGVIETNGVTANFKTRCHSAGHIYVVAFGQEAFCAANAPTGTATSNTGWLYLEDGGPTATQPTWSAAQTWYFSAPLTAEPTNPNMQTLFSGFYVEVGQNPCVLGNTCRLDPARQLVPVWRYDGTLHGGYMYGSALTMIFNNQITANGVGVFLGGFSSGPQSGVATASASFLDNTQFSSTLHFRRWAAGVPNYDALITSDPFDGLTLSGIPTVKLSIGAGFGARTVIAVISNAGFDIQTGKVLSYNGTTILNGGVLTAAAFPAYTGDVTRPAGSLVTTIANSVVTYAKMQNVSATARLLGRATAGAGVVEELGLLGGLIISGTSLSLGAITPTSVASTGAITSSGGGIGYATGAGGTVAQATSKATGVILDKLCGDITLNAAALAASTTVSFVLTNNKIAAGDTICLSHNATGTFGAYTLNAHGMAAGSCTIDVRNVSLGSLSEAIVIRYAIIKAVQA